MTGEVSRLVDRLFVGTVTVTGTTRSGEPEDLTAATLEAAGRDTDA